MDPRSVDLHGLFAVEAAYYAERAINDAQDKGYTYLNFITGTHRILPADADSPPI